MMKILLFGSRGNVGFELRRLLCYNFELICYTSKDIDFSKDFDRLHDIIIKHSPDVIVNAAAYTAVDLAESEEKIAEAINSRSVSTIAKAAKIVDSLLVHYSTDYIFDGTKEKPYLEDDLPSPKSVYGRTKLAGEIAIINSDCRHIILRTSWVYSLWGNNFIKTIANLAKERESLDIVNDQFGTPTSASLLADITAFIIHKEVNNDIKTILHLTPEGETSWHGLGCYLINELKNRGIILKTELANINAVSTEDFPRAAARPKNSVLDSNKLQTKYDISFPTWDYHVSLYLDQMIKLKGI